MWGEKKQKHIWQSKVNEGKFTCPEFIFLEKSDANRNETKMQISSFWIKMISNSLRSYFVQADVKSRAGDEIWASAKEPEIKKDEREICFCLMFGKSQRWGECRDTERMSACMHACQCTWASAVWREVGEKQEEEEEEERTRRSKVAPH